VLLLAQRSHSYRYGWPNYTLQEPAPEARLAEFRTGTIRNVCTLYSPVCKTMDQNLTSIMENYIYIPETKRQSRLSFPSAFCVSFFLSWIYLIVMFNKKFTKFQRNIFSMSLCLRVWQSAHIFRTDEYVIKKFATEKFYRNVWHVYPNMFFITPNKRTVIYHNSIYHKSISKYCLIYTPTCFVIYISSSGSVIFVPCQVTQILKLNAVKITIT
jgi:hypothetical protein